MLSLAVCLTPLEGAAAPAEPAATRDAAMRQLKQPSGMGGCMFRALPIDVRREALLSALAGDGNPQTLRAATPEVAQKCIGQSAPSSNLALVGSLVGAVRKAAAALALATQFGVGQDSLDAAWAGAPPAQKAAFYEVADEFLTPDQEISVRALDVAGLAAKMGFEPDAHPGAEPALRTYFLAAALSERSEAMLTKRA